MKWKNILPLVYDKTYTFYADLSMDECLRKFENCVNKEKFLPTLYGKDVLGKIKGYEFRLSNRQFVSGDEFKPYFYGRFIQNDTGTKIDGGFRVLTLPKWFAYAFVFLIVLIVPAKEFVKKGMITATGVFSTIIVVSSLILRQTHRKGKYETDKFPYRFFTRNI